MSTLIILTNGVLLIAIGLLVMILLDSKRDKVEIKKTLTASISKHKRVIDDNRMMAEQNEQQLEINKKLQLELDVFQTKYNMQRIMLEIWASSEDETGLAIKHFLRTENQEVAEI